MSIVLSSVENWIRLIYMTHLIWMIMITIMIMEKYLVRKQSITENDY